MKKKIYKQIPELKSEQEYANFWNNVSDITEYLDPKRFKSVSAEAVLSHVPSITTQVAEIRKLAKLYGTKTEILLYKLLRIGLRSFPNNEQTIR